jgi:type II secretory pathway component PulF
MQSHWSDFDASQRLSADEAAGLAARVAELTKAGLPLGEGLRAMASELSCRRVRNVLEALADRLDAGDGLATAIDSLGSRLPPHLRGLILAGLRSGHLAEALEEYVDLERTQGELRRRLLSSFAYPEFLLAVLAVVVVLTQLFVVGGFHRIFMDFGCALPVMTTLFIQCSGPATVALVVLLCVMVALPCLIAASPRFPLFWRALYKLPVLGPLVRWIHVAHFARLMSMMTEQSVPLPDALRLTSAGLRDVNLASACCRAADGIDRGQSPAESMRRERQFPASAIPLVEWGQQGAALSDAFRAIADMFEGRVRSQGSLLQATLLPVIFLTIVTFVGVFATAMMLPLIDLIKKLS